jgi:CheY-like chemotaxis protein
VLIVSDDEAFRSRLRALFNSDSGFDSCAEAANAIEALNTAKDLLPNLVVLDLPEPGMDGLQLAQDLRAITPKLPIFLLTTNHDVNCEKLALSYGITAVFCKPDDLVTLVANARAACGIE